MKIQRIMFTSLLCLVIISCKSQQETVISTPTNVASMLVTSAEPSANTSLPTPYDPTPIVTSFVTPDTQEVFIQTSIKQNYRVFGDLYMMDGCPHSGLFGVRLSNNANLASWWGIVFYEPYDISKYPSLNFWVKGDLGRESFLVVIKDKSDSDIEIKSSSLNVSVSELEWHLVKVPLNLMSTGGDLVTEIKSFAIGVIPSDQIETICIDDVYFSIRDKSVEQ